MFLLSVFSVLVTLLVDQLVLYVPPQTVEVVQEVLVTLLVALEVLPAIVFPRKVERLVFRE